VTNPPLLTVAIDEFELVHVTDNPEGLVVHVNCIVPPTVICVEGAVTLTFMVGNIGSTSPKGTMPPSAAAPICTPPKIITILNNAATHDL
jgi:hypothetical protein